jgi:hypothetical protein
MRYTINANKLKAIARMNKHKDMRIECDTVFYLLRSLTDQWGIAN